jgi:hypothetical protein
MDLTGKRPIAIDPILLGEGFRIILPVTNVKVLLDKILFIGHARHIPLS